MKEEVIEDVIEDERAHFPSCGGHDFASFPLAWNGLRGGGLGRLGFAAILANDAEVAPCRSARLAVSRAEGATELLAVASRR